MVFMCHVTFSKKIGQNFSKLVEIFKITIIYVIHASELQFILHKDTVCVY
jgi:hypothetical protein